MGLDVIYAHVDSMDYLRRNFEHAHWDTFTDGACAVREKRQPRRVTSYLHKTRPPVPNLN